MFSLALFMAVISIVREEVAVQCTMGQYSNLVGDVGDATIILANYYGVRVTAATNNNSKQSNRMGTKDSCDRQSPTEAADTDSGVEIALVNI